ncbi:DapH/DapD/GlmU-related protein [uncultured Algibacter sp.]|uniref:DapH/DapD/GlmU-related protein n=1 Tax=uncultured Algibacter sp. TaxID=298659 RepID=UPI002618D026|nr:DapH/DapD/GlmU-related protein [uncultured Algibacter sp.]
MSFSPIVLFAFNRPKHTQRTLDALSSNPEASKSELYIFCDGPKNHINEQELKNINKVHEIAKAEDRFQSVKVIVSDKNKGLAQSIINGVTEVVKKHGRVIVLEDDIETSSGFLNYMNNALNLYQENDEVMHISGYMFPHRSTLQSTFFYNVPLCWGWATWEKSWKHFNEDALFLWNELKQKKLLNNLDKFGGDYLSSQLADNISGKLNTWFVKWHASVLLKNGYILFPNKSLVQNFGFDNTGEHNGVHTEFHHSELAKDIEVKLIDVIEDENASLIIKNFYKSLKEKPTKKHVKRSIKNKLRNLFFLIFPDLKKVLRYNQNIVQIKTYLGKKTKVYPSSRLSNSIIGNYTYISENSVINNAVIGKFCSIGANFMAGRGVHPTTGISTHPMFYSTAKQNGMTLSSDNKIEEFKPITIGNDVFIGMNVTVLDGVTIADGAIIGAGAVVSKDIPPYAIAVGNPIEIIKYRFEDVTIEKLLDIKWWNYNSDDLHLVEKYFFQVEDFLQTIKKAK